VKRIDWLILKSYLGPFLMSFGIILFILVMQFMALYMHEIFGKGLGLVVMLKLFYYAGGRLAITAMPVAILAAALMTYGSMGEHYELAAMKSCGISLFKAMRSVLVFGIILTAFSIWFSFDIIPRANLKFFSLYYDVQRTKPSVAIKPGYFYADIDGYVIRVADKNNDTGKLFDVILYNHTENRGNVDVIIADSARTMMNMQESALQMVMYHGSRYQEYKHDASGGVSNKHSLGRMSFDSLYFQFNLEGFELSRTDEGQFRHQIILPRKELISAIDSLYKLEDKSQQKFFKQVGRYTKIDTNFVSYFPDTLAWTSPIVNLTLDEDIVSCYRLDSVIDVPNLLSTAVIDARAVKSYMEFMIKKKSSEAKSQRKYQYEFYLRHSLPINCLLFMLIGASLGAIIRSGGLGMPALISIVLFMSFYILITQGKKLAQEGVLEPWAGAGLPIFVFAPLAILVTIQATTDAKIFDESVWSMVVDKISYRVNRLFGINHNKS